jgi:hypothetical protein
MGLKDTILDGFQTLSEKISADDVPLSGVDPEKLNTELERRAAHRENHPVKEPVDNAIARAILPGPKNTGIRKRAAEKRERRIHADKAKQAAASKKAQNEAFRRMQAESARSQARSSHSSGPRRSSSSSRSSSGSRSRGARRPSPYVGQMAEHYRTLGLDASAELPEIKSAYRKLMRKYHPDLHTGDAKKQKAATELSMKISVAYNSLVDALE